MTDGIQTWRVMSWPGNDAAQRGNLASFCGVTCRREGRKKRNLPHVTSTSQFPAGSRADPPGCPCDQPPTWAIRGSKESGAGRGPGSSADSQTLVLHGRAGPAPQTSKHTNKRTGVSLPKHKETLRQPAHQQLRIAWLRLCAPRAPTH